MYWAHISVACLVFARAKLCSNIFQGIRTPSKKFKENKLAFWHLNAFVCSYLTKQHSDFLGNVEKFRNKTFEDVRGSNGNTITAQNDSSGTDFRFVDADEI